MSSQEFQFVPPAEAPVFRPTWEEFQDALQYINRIRPVAEQYGICKIIPPPDWQPPFAVDVDNFKFTPRIQRLNELEAHTRIKLNFLDQIAKFWELQGSSLKIPVLEKKALDLYSLHKRVQDAGGAESVSRHRGWNRIASGLGFASQKNLGAQLKILYEKILQPFDIFNRSKEVPLGKDKGCSEDDPDYVAEPRDYKPHQIPSRMAGKIPENEKNGRRSRRYQPSGGDDDDDDCPEDSKELKRLQFKGPGPKNADVDKDTKTKGRSRKNVLYTHDPLAKYICLNCGRGDDEDQMLLCDGCDDSYHTFCLVPSLPEIPKGDWRCPKCVAVEVSKPLEAFGFEQAQKEYNLQSFGEMADKFKQDYFNMPVHLVPLDMAEREFWRIVSSIDEDVTVEYGADLHTMDHGSGFPTHHSSNLMPADKEYANDSWNLNNLPVQEGSVLAHIGCDISGMKVPWMYVGMCFSTFCWHNEDHWSYSINYLHWGEPKTWYGVPGGEAERFEECMKAAAPELFQSQPDLLHQLVTIMNPNILMKAGVPIVRCDQHAGEFMITFPRSYHAGFNQGYNFAEAVNFAPPDWLSIGRECIQHYSNLKRYCVFSHDELVCKMAATPDSLDLTVAAATYQDMLKMVEAEKRHRKALLHWGVKNAEREAFELCPDDERQCDFCKTTCFLSAVTCPCSPGKLVCLRHYDLMCQCAPGSRVLRYRFTLDELPPMLQNLKERAESFDIWATKVKQALETRLPEDKLEVDELRALVSYAEQKRFPESDLMGALIAAVNEADKCAAVASHLTTQKVRTRTRINSDPKNRLTLTELELFHEQISSLACNIREADGVKQLLDTVLDYRDQAVRALADSDKWLAEWQMRPPDSDEEDVDSKKPSARKGEEDGSKMDVDGGDEGEKQTKPASGKKNMKRKKRVVGKATKEEKDDNNAIKKEEEGVKEVADIKKDVKVDNGSSDKMEVDDAKSDAANNVKSESSEDATSSDEEDEFVQSEELVKIQDALLALDIDLPELHSLRNRLLKVRWLEDVQDSLDPPSAVTCDVVRQLLHKSLQLPPHRCVEHARVQLQALMTDILEWDARAAALLNSKTCPVKEAEELLLEAERVPAQLPAVAGLRDAVKKAREWQAKASAVCRRCQPSAGAKGKAAGEKKTGAVNGTDVTNASVDAKKKVSPDGSESPPSDCPVNFPTPSLGKTPAPLLESVEALLQRARTIPLELPELRSLEDEVNLAHSWLEKTARTFLKKNSHYTLIEVLVPRTEVGLVASGGNKRKRPSRREDQSTLQQTASLLDTAPDQDANATLLVKAYKDCEEREVKAVRALRNHNLSKRYQFSSSSKTSSGTNDGTSSDDDPTPATFCVCHRPATRDMLQCSVCCDRFHPTCVPSSLGGRPPHFPPPLPSASTTGPNETNTPLPGDCSPGPDGRLDDSLSVTRFICSSCHRSRRPRLDTILSLLMALHKIRIRLCEAGALQCLTERAMAWQDRAQQLLQTQELRSAIETLATACKLITEQQASDDSADKSNDGLWGPDLGLNKSGGSDSTSNIKPGASSSFTTTPPLCKARITSLLAGISLSPDKPLVTLPLATRQQIKELLMEGELLEVTLEETLQLWRVLQVSENPVSKISEILVMLSNSSSSGGGGGAGGTDDKNKKTGAAAKKRKSGGGKDGNIAVTNNAGNATSKLVGGSRTANRSPKRAKIAAGGAGASTPAATSSGSAGVAKADDGSPAPAKKLLKKKASSTSKLTEGATATNKRKSEGLGPISQSKKRRPLPASQSSSSISTAGAAKLVPPKSPKKQPVKPATNAAANSKTPQNNANTSASCTSSSGGAGSNSGNTSGSNVNNSGGINFGKKSNKKKTKRPAKGSSSHTSSSSEDDEICAATRCKIPVGTAVDWVQCDQCNGWFHYVCVGLKSSDLREDEDYICTACAPSMSRQAKTSVAKT